MLHWTPCPRPPRAPITGRSVQLVPLDADAHGGDLFAAFRGDDALWDYMSYGPFATAGAHDAWLREKQAGADPLFFAILPRATGRAAGVASYLRITPEHGVIEIGHICLGRALQRTTAATEAIFLMIRTAFDLGYRRCEWKCDARNLASRRAAQRLGFGFEGIFRQHRIVRDRNRDTAWLAITDGDWTALAPVFDTWLAAENHDAIGAQRQQLSRMTRALRVADPALAPRTGGATPPVT